MRAFLSLLSLALLLSVTASCHDLSNEPSNGDDASNGLKVALITGGHEFDVPNFYQLFRELPGIDVYPQHLEHFASSDEATRDSYDVVVFYGMERGEAPDDDAAPHYAGKPKAALERLFEQGQGVVIMHHAILAWEKWPFWDEVVGYSERNFRWAPGLTLDVRVAEGDHPVTRGMAPFTTVDEAYVLHGEHDGKGDVLLTVEHEDSMPEVAWAREVGKSRVFVLTLGDNKDAWANEGFRAVLGRGIEWTAGKEKP